MSHSTRLIVLLGVISLLNDITYEGARSLAGPFLGGLGASAAAVGFVSGAGELLGHSLRLISGYFTDKTKRYWLMAFVGYALNLIAVPLLALANRWEIAALLFMLERTGKAIRTPARDVMLSQASHSIGRGWGFGLHEAMDQIGAVSGPLIVSAVLARSGDYHAAFAALAIPAMLAMVCLCLARWTYPNPELLEKEPALPQPDGLPSTFWLYIAAAGLLAAGAADFPLVAYHVKKMGLAPDRYIPMLYSLAMGTGAVTSLILGRLFDRHGIPVLMFAAALSIVTAPMLFLGDLTAVAAGMARWGAGLGAMESIMKAVVADMVPLERRGSAYGIFNTGYGVMWFAGSAAMGWLYDRSPVALVILSVALQAASVPVLAVVWRRLRAARLG